MGFIYSRNVCQKEVITFNRLWEECTQEEAQLIIIEESMGATKDQTLTIQRSDFMILFWYPFVYIQLMCYA